MTVIEFPVTRNLGRPSAWPYVASCGLGFAFSLAITLGWGLKLTPDVSLYVHSGVGVYPSILGTLVGSAGLATLAVFHALAFGVLVMLLVRARPGWVPLLLAVPVLWWTLPLGVDTIAAVLLVLALRQRSSGALAIGFHYAALPVAAAIWTWRSRYGALSIAVCGLLAIVLAVATPYGSAVTFDPWAAAKALPAFSIVLTIAFAPALGLHLSREAWKAVAVFGSGTALVVLYATTAHVHSGETLGVSTFAASRYALPLTVALLVAGQAYGRAERPKTAPGKGLT